MEQMLLTLNKSLASKSRCVAYCRHHHVYLTSTQYKGRQCLNKQCSYFEKIDHPLWRHRENIKNTKKNK